MLKPSLLSSIAIFTTKTISVTKLLRLKIHSLVLNLVKSRL